MAKIEALKLLLHPLWHRNRASTHQEGHPFQGKQVGKQVQAGLINNIYNIIGDMYE